LHRFEEEVFKLEVLDAKSLEKEMAQPEF